MLTPGIEF